MIRIDDHFTDRLFSTFGYIGPKRLAYLEKSWAGLFRSQFLTFLPMKSLIEEFSKTMGRPTKELYAMVGMLVLQSLFNYTTQELIEAFQFNELWRFALDISDQSDESMYICDRTVRYYRKKMIEKGLMDEVFRTLTDEMIRAFAIPTGHQRLDSTHILSNMKELRRLDLFVETIEDFLNELRRLHPTIFKRDIPQEMRKRYLEKKCSCFSQVKGEEARKTLQEVANDLLFIVRQFEEHDTIKQLKTMALLQRLLDEQCSLQGDTKQETITLKDPKEVASTSLQNPSDPDATYDGHKGQGYQAQLMETYQEEKTTPNLITYVHVEAAHESDERALQPALEETLARGCAPELLVADTAYGSDENVEQAKANGVNLVAPTKGTRAKAEEMLVLRDFETNPETNVVSSCPAGHAPLKTIVTQDGIHTAHFDPEKCRHCEYCSYCQVGQNDCPPRITYSEKELRLEKRRKYEKTKEFKEIYRMRSGIEATNANFKKDFPNGQTRTRGLKSVTYEIMGKALMTNFMRIWRFYSGNLTKITVTA